MEARRGPRRRLAARLLTSAVALAVAVTLGARWLTLEQQDWLVAGCTMIGVMVGVSLFWITDRDLGWVGAAALLLALTPPAVHHAAAGVLLSSKGRLDRCVVTSVESRAGATDVLPAISYRQQLDCAASGAREITLSHPAAEAGTRLVVWVDAAARLEPVAVRDAQAPSTRASTLAAVAILLGLVVSGSAAARRAGPRGAQPT